MYQLFVCVNERISTGNKVEHRYNVFRVFIKKEKKKSLKCEMSIIIDGHC